MNLIPFTQYHLPNGRKTEAVFVCKDSATYAKAERIRSAGFVFECKILTTGEVSLTIHDPKKEEDITIQVCNNDMEIHSWLSKLINDFDLKGEKP